MRGDFIGHSIIVLKSATRFREISSPILNEVLLSTQVKRIN